MNDKEIKQKQKDAMALRKQIGDHEYRKIKAQKQRKAYEKRQNDLKALVGEKYLPTQKNPPEIPKKRGCSVTLTVIDENGEYSFTWGASSLMGSVVATQRGQGYLDMAKPALQQLYGKLT